MTKKKVSILIVLMAISLIGILGLQLAWMRNALEVRNELFDRSVTEALIATTYKAERFSDAFWLQNEFMPFRHDAFPSKRPGWGRPNGPRDTMRNKRQMNNIRQEDSNLKRNTIKDATDSVYERNKDSALIHIEKEIEEKAIAFFKRINADDSGTRKSIKPDNDLVRGFSNKVERLKDVAGQMAYEGWGAFKYHMPDTMLINKILADELMFRNIPIQFFSGVFTDSLGLIKPERADSALLSKSKYRAILYPNSFFNQNEKLSIYFPGREMFVYSKLIGTALLSMAFCIFILVIFALSIHYIVSQKKISEMKSDFINNMTHEFKTPLATISVAADTILNPKIISSPDKVSHFVQAIKKENQRMNQQVETILQIARLDKKEFEFTYKPLNVHELIEKSIQNILLQVESRNGTIETNFTAQNPVVTADAGHLSNLINNLLDNANKYSPENPEITISTRNVKTGIWISVADKGIGMNKHSQQRIFEKFYRETSGNIHNVKGFGLGLSYSKAVVEAHKGQINVHSELGKGSTFEVFLPFTV